jgi:hypothetical protein
VRRISRGRRIEDAGSQLLEDALLAGALRDHREPPVSRSRPSAVARSHGERWLR